MFAVEKRTAEAITPGKGTKDMTVSTAVLGSARKLVRELLPAPVLAS